MRAETLTQIRKTLTTASGGGGRYLRAVSLEKQRVRSLAPGHLQKFENSIRFPVARRDAPRINHLVRQLGKFANGAPTPTLTRPTFPPKFRRPWQDETGRGEATRVSIVGGFFEPPRWNYVTGGALAHGATRNRATDPLPWIIAAPFSRESWSTNFVGQRGVQHLNSVRVVRIVDKIAPALVPANFPLGILAGGA